MTSQLLRDGDFAPIIDAMTNDEKVDLLSGHRMWRTQSIDRLDVPGIVMTDGTYGVRYSIDQIDQDSPAGQDFGAFLSVVGRRAKEVEVAWGTMKPATCFPNGSSVGCSWDQELAYTLGEALALECQALGVNLLLGPGINIRRTPLGGRSYEYYAEDPVVAGDFAAGVIQGLQDNGVGASLKHFACNNSEVERTTMDSVVDERALREIYLRGFERAVRKANPWTVMSSYNLLNGVQAAESHWLLTKVLREDWGYDGLVVSDWHGIKNRPASLLAGNDLDMPESETRKSQLLAAIENGEIPADVLDRACARVLELVRRAKAGERAGVTFDKAEHHALARRIAGESIVLLKNENAILPLRPESYSRIAIVGRGAVEPVIQGSGCATTTPTRIDIPLDEITKLCDGRFAIDYYPGYGPDPSTQDGLRAEAVAGAAGAEIVIVFADADGGYDGEGSDRKTLDLAPGHDALISALAAVAPNVVVVLANPDAVTMPWLDEVQAVVETFFSGQAMGGGVADVLFGVANPSGKLTVTFPKRMEDMPTWLTYPGENSKHVYSEGFFVGYRWYDKRSIEPLFPFGFGLSYTRFAYSDLVLDRSELRAGQTLRLTFSLTNIGAVAGKEVCQIYAQYTRPRLHRPLRELKAFAKVDLQPGETRLVSIDVPAADLAYFDPARGEWLLDEDDIVLCVGASSRDIRLEGKVHCHSKAPQYRRIARDTQPTFVLANPIAKRAFNALLQRKLDVSEDDAARILDHCANSFFGIFTTFDRRFRQKFSEAEIVQVLAEIETAMATAETDAHEMAEA